MNPINKAYTLNAGRVDAGRLRPSGGGGVGGGGTGSDISWVPPVGYFADVPMTNLANSQAPAIYAGDSFAVRSPFLTYGGSAIISDFSTLGAQAFYTGGHESSSAQTNSSMVLLCDFSSLTWFARNVPLQANPANTGDNNGRFPDGSYYCFHTYCGLQNFPAAWGGGTSGSLIAIGRDVYSPDGKAITVADVSYPTVGYSSMVTNQFENALTTRLRWNATSAGLNQPTSDIDVGRQGWWVAEARGTVSYTLFIHKSGLVTQHKGLNGNMADGTLFYIESAKLLVAVDGGYETGPEYRRLYIRDTLTPHPTDSNDIWYNTTTGTVPGANGPRLDQYGATTYYHGPAYLGLQWVEELGAAFGLDNQVSPPRVVKLTPPASGDWKTTPWVWSAITLQHWASDTSGYATLRPVRDSGAFSKFRWVPTLHAFVYCVDADVKPQVIRI